MTTLSKNPRTASYFPVRFNPFENFFKNDFLDYWNGNSEITVPSINVTEGKSNYKIEMAAPGLKRDDFNIDVSDNLMTICCEKENETREDGENNFSRREYNYSSFSRSFTVPQNADAEHIEAKYSDGVLSLNIPKMQDGKKANGRKIKVG